MPIVAIVDGVVIQIYFGDHPPPHFHASIGEHRAVIDISTQALLVGELPQVKLKIIRKWAKLHQSDLMECWRKAVMRLNPGKIS